MPSEIVNFEGVDTLVGTLKALKGRLKGAGEASMAQLAYAIFDLSQDQVPVRHGILKGSGNVRITNESPLELTIGYGGPAAGYALWVHENLTAHHAPPTKAKYLQDPFNQLIGTAEQTVAADVEGAIVGQMPGEASVAQRQGMAESVVQHAGTPGSAKSKAMKYIAAHAQPMTDADIRKAISAIDTGKAIRRAGGSSRIRTYRAKGLAPRKKS
jgi:hypothetical protein